MTTGTQHGRADKTPPKESEFVRTTEHTRPLYSHTCNPRIQPFAQVHIIKWGEQVILCPKCRHAETWILNATNQRWITA